MQTISFEMYYPIASGSHTNGQILYEIPGSAQLHIGDSWSKLNHQKKGGNGDGSDRVDNVDSNEWGFPLSARMFLLGFKTIILQVTCVLS